jgi:catalase
VAQIESESAKAAIVTLKVQGEVDSKGQLHPLDMAPRASPSVPRDAVMVWAGPDGDQKLSSDSHAVSFVMDAVRHCKAVGIASHALAGRAGPDVGPGIVDLAARGGVKEFITAACTGRFWEREAEQ